MTDGDIVLDYDETVDAAYLTLAAGAFDHQVRLDDARGVNYAADGSVLGIELLSPRRKGVNLVGLPRREDVARVMRAASFRVLQGQPR